jgi:hypothetical protein
MRLNAIVYLFLSFIRFCIISASYEYKKRSTRRTQFVPDDMLKMCLPNSTNMSSIRNSNLLMTSFSVYHCLSFVPWLPSHTRIYGNTVVCQKGHGSARWPNNLLWNNAEWNAYFEIWKGTKCGSGQQNKNTFQDTRFIFGKIPHGTDKCDRCIGHTRMIIFYVKKQ